jgi:hypothetical protein
MKTAIATDTGVELSRDGGQTWSSFSRGLAFPWLHAVRKVIPDPAVPGRFFVLPLDGGVFEAIIE